MVQQAGMRGPNRAVSGHSRAQAQIGVVEINRESLGIEPTGRLKGLAAHDHARPGDRREGLDLPCPALVTRGITGNAMVGMTGHMVATQHHTRMLILSVGIEQLGADHAAAGALHPRHHLGKPIRLQRFDLIVEKTEH